MVRMILAESLTKSASTGARLDKKLNRTLVMRAAYRYAIQQFELLTGGAVDGPFGIWMHRLAENGQLYSQENPQYARTSSLFSEDELRAFYKIAISSTYALGMEVEAFADARIVLTPSQIIYESVRWGLLVIHLGEEAVLSDPVASCGRLGSADFQSLQAMAIDIATKIGDLQSGI